MNETEPLPTSEAGPVPPVPPIPPALAASAAKPEPAPKPEPKPVRPKRLPPLWPAAGLLGFLLLAGGEGYLWYLYKTLPDESAQVTDLQSQVVDLQAARTLAVAAPAAAEPPVGTGIQAQADMAQRLAAVGAQVNAMQTQMASDHGALTALQADNTDLTALTAKMALLNRLETARMALQAGQPLGDIPDAPPALEKFAFQAPPTEAALILSFPVAARAAESASIAGRPKGSYWSAMLARMENLITISNGDQVIVGAPASAVIEKADELLDAGDLAGAVAALDTLSPATQAAMGDWLTQARGLLAARAAMITMAGQS